MSLTVKRMLAGGAIGLIAALVMGGAQGQAQAPAQGGPLRWTKAAPFPLPEEELYGSVVNGKWYVIGGFGFAPCGGCPPGLIYEYDPAGDKWTKKKTMPVPVHHQAQAVYQNKIYIFGGCLRAITGEGGRPTRGSTIRPPTRTRRSRRCRSNAARPRRNRSAARSI